MAADPFTVLSTIGASLVSGGVAAVLTNFFSRGREREAEWRKLKFNQYQEFLLALSGIVEERQTPEAHVRYADACNGLSLAASHEVLRALWELQAFTRGERGSKTLDAHDGYLSVLIGAMRADLMAKDTKARAFQFRLIAPPASREP